MKLFSFKRPPLTKVIGVGAAGIKAVNHLYKQDITGVDFFIFDTDTEVLELSPVPNKVQPGTNLTRGISAWSVPKGYQTASIENIEDIKTMLEFDTKMLFYYPTVAPLSALYIAATVQAVFNLQR